MAPLSKWKEGLNRNLAFLSGPAWSSRKKRSLEMAASDPLQSRITDYWKILSNIEKLARENEKLSLLLQQAYDASCEPCSHISFTNMLKEMICNAEKNCGQHRTHRRHPIILKKFATALFYLLDPWLMNLFITICLRHFLVCEVFKLPFIKSIKPSMRALLDLMNLRNT